MDSASFFLFRKFTQPSPKKKKKGPIEHILFCTYGVGSKRQMTVFMLQLHFTLLAANLQTASLTMGFACVLHCVGYITLAAFVKD